MEAGRELDAEVAEKVMGIDLRIPRYRALSLVGATYTSETGPAFTLRTGDVVGIPDNLAVLPEDASANERYFRYVAEWLIGECDDPEVNAKVARLVAEARATPKSYSTDIAAAWEVVTQLGDRFHARITTPFAGPGGKYFCGFTPLHTSGWSGRPDHEAGAATAPLAICLAALSAVTPQGDSQA